MTRSLGSLALVAFLVASGEPPTRIITIDPLWWNLLEAAMVVTSLVIHPLEVRHARRRRHTPRHAAMESGAGEPT